jgi:hypothetical protein
LNCPARLLTGEGEFSLTTTFWACSYQVMEGSRSRTCSRNTHQNIRHPSVSRCSRLHKDRAQGSSRVRIGNAGPAVLRSSTGEFFNACQPNLEVRGDPAFFPGLPTALIEPDSIRPGNAAGAVLRPEAAAIGAGAEDFAFVVADGAWGWFRSEY